MDLDENKSNDTLPKMKFEAFLICTTLRIVNCYAYIVAWHKNAIAIICLSFGLCFQESETYFSYFHSSFLETI